MVASLALIWYQQLRKKKFKHIKQMGLRYVGVKILTLAYTCTPSFENSTQVQYQPLIISVFKVTEDFSSSIASRDWRHLK